MPAHYLTYTVLAVGVLATAVLSMAGGWSLANGLQAFLLLGALTYLTLKVESARQQLEELRGVQDAYAQLDQQTKVLIRTDLELHRTQEELDRRLASLMALHTFGRQIQVSMRPEEIYSKLDATLVSHFGFAKGLLAQCPTSDSLQWRSMVGVNPQLAETLKAHIQETGLLKHFLTAGHPTTLTAASAAADPAQRTLLQLLGTPTAVIAGVIPHGGAAGLLLLGRSGSSVSAKADEELVSILINQLAIAVENSSLYEKTWMAQQELERKVQDRTRELAAANAALIELNKAKSDFVSAVSHELRTPLAAIKGYAALLNSGQFGKLAGPQGERLLKIEKHADLLAQFINNLLDIARIESGRVTMEKRSIQVEEFLTMVQDVVQPQMQAKQLQYAVECDGVRELVGDMQQLQRVFVNLLSNAIKYTPEGGTIRLGLSREGDKLIARVSDTGCGMSPEDLGKLFQEFFRSADPINQQIKGTGLGLALVKRIIDAHHGTITVASEKGKGSTFTVRLPVS